MKTLQQNILPTPLGDMIAIADKNALYLLEFFDCKNLEREIERLRIRTKSSILPGTTPQINSIQKELDAYFARTLKKFLTPINLLGSPFQKKVWAALMDIPYGQTRSYLDQARAIEQPTACRAVANANGANQLALIVPCHRIINSNGQLGGYGGGTERKQWLLSHEKKNV